MANNQNMTTKLAIIRICPKFCNEVLLNVEINISAPRIRSTILTKKKMEAQRIIFQFWCGLHAARAISNPKVKAKAPIKRMTMKYSDFIGANTSNDIPYIADAKSIAPTGARVAAVPIRIW